MTPRLRYVPLGGLGEVGLNMFLLEWEKQLLIVDAGLMFPHEESPGVDLIVPDLSYLLEAGRKPLGVVVTHGHEDHVGGLPFLLKKVNVPVYGTRLTLGLLQHRLREHRVLGQADLRTIAPGDRVQLGPFRVEAIAVCHSIPDTIALGIETPVGRVLYTADFKLETDPPYGYGTDLVRLRRLGEEGVHLLLSDSTNAEREGHSGSERDLGPAFERIFEEAPGRIVVTTFASNIHRMQRVIALAEKHGRHIAVAGRSMRNAFHTARQLGYLEVPEGMVLRLAKAGDDPRLVLITAGSQGEPVSALARFATRSHKDVNVREGDWVVLSARPIPGNERLVQHTINNLYRNGAERVFYAESDKVHVSGHGYREELREMIRMTRPHFFVPVHGEYRQLHLHAKLAREEGIPAGRIHLLEDGRLLEVGRDSLADGGESGAGLVYVDGLGIGDVEQVVLRDRQLLAQDGILVVTITVERDTGRLRTPPQVISRGVIAPESAPELEEGASAAAAEALRGNVDRDDLAVLRERVHSSVARFVHRRVGRRPLVMPIITEV
ncbi:MAG: ribonuclease J [Candidatus Dormibacteraceae bacterium]